MKAYHDRPNIPHETGMDDNDSLGLMLDGLKEAGHLVGQGAKGIWRFGKNLAFAGGDKLISGYAKAMRFAQRDIWNYDRKFWDIDRLTVPDGSAWGKAPSGQDWGRYEFDWALARLQAGASLHDVREELHGLKKQQRETRKLQQWHDRTIRYLNNVLSNDQKIGNSRNLSSYKQDIAEHKLEWAMHKRENQRLTKRLNGMRAAIMTQEFENLIDDPFWWKPVSATQWVFRGALHNPKYVGIATGCAVALTGCATIKLPTRPVLPQAATASDIELAGIHKPFSVRRMEPTFDANIAELDGALYRINMIDHDAHGLPNNKAGVAKAAEDAIRILRRERLLTNALKDWTDEDLFAWVMMVANKESGLTTDIDAMGSSATSTMQGLKRTQFVQAGLLRGRVAINSRADRAISSILIANYNELNVTALVDDSERRELDEWNRFADIAREGGRITDIRINVDKMRRLKGLRGKSDAELRERAAYIVGKAYDRQKNSNGMAIFNAERKGDAVGSIMMALTSLDQSYVMAVCGRGQYGNIHPFACGYGVHQAGPRGASVIFKGSLSHGAYARVVAGNNAYGNPKLYLDNRRRIVPRAETIRRFYSPDDARLAQDSYIVAEALFRHNYSVDSAYDGKRAEDIRLKRPAARRANALKSPFPG